MAAKPEIPKRSRHAIAGREIEASAVRKADGFQQLSPRSQALQRPGMWLGSVIVDPTVKSCFDGVSVRRKEIPDYVEGVDKTYCEILSNSVDNCTYSIHCGRVPDEIHVTLTPTTITIQNGGCNVPVDKMANGAWIPSMLWGEMFTSSHYEEARKAYKASSTSGGCNGLGAALVNIFSTRFEVLVEDPESHRRFQQVWSSGKPLAEQEPIITSSKKIVDTLIKVTYTLNFPFFGLENYSPLMLELFAFHAITASFTAKVPVTITNALGVSTRYDVRLLKNYASLFPELSPTPSIKRLEYCMLSSEAVAKGITYEDAVQKHIEIPRIEALLVDDLVEEGTVAATEKGKTAGSKTAAAARASSRKATGAYQLSFVNGICTSEHGVHVNELVEAFFGAALKELKISVANGRRHISFLLSVRLPSPLFRDQGKRSLASPKPVFDDIPASVLRALRTWNTMARLTALNEAEQMVGLKKSDGKKLRRLTQLTELDDANFAGTSASHTCTLIIVEGGSAATYPEILRDRIPGGRDSHGILYLRGKPLNVLNASIAQLSGETGSLVYPNFKQALGLQDGIDYSTSANFKKLRYGHALIATDADCDGWHILCLLLLMFHARFPSLVNRGYISYLRTPVLRVPGAQGLTFFTKRAYLEWKAQATGGVQATMAKRKPKYYKGLGSSNAKDVEEDLRSKRGRLGVTDEDGKATEALDLGFNEKRAGDRKSWLATPVEGEFLDTDATSQPIAQFVHTGLKLYSLDNIQRAIPNVMDGLKESMRKALAAGFKRFGLKSGDRRQALSKQEKKTLGLKSTVYEVPPEAKVFQIIGSTTEHFCYHHGEPILGEVISNMCKEYVGTNNVTWFQPVSSFGTIDSGRAPDARYASLGPAWWWSYAFSPMDSELVDYVYDEGIKCEPRFFLPVACWALCNQADGVGTGYSTRIPGHNIEEVVLAHLCLLEGRRTFPRLMPWWRGFRGTVSLLPRSRARKMVAVEHSVDVDDIDGEAMVYEGPREEEAMVCIVDGTYSIQGNMVIVTALPLRTFKEFATILAKLIDEKVVSDYRNRSVDEDIRFEIEMCVDPETGSLPAGNLMKLFRLRKLIAMTNLVLLDENGLPRRYRSAEEILIYFHEKRLGFYEKRRQSIIRNLRDKLQNLDNRMKLVKLLISKGPEKIIYEERPEEEILAEITAKLPEVPHEIYRELNIRQLNQNQIIKLTTQLAEAQTELGELEATTKEAMWKCDLLAFLREYRAIYGGSNVSAGYKEMPW